MNASIPLFIDESTIRSCPTEQIDRIVEINGYTSFVSEEIISGVRRLSCAAWIGLRLAEKRLTEHRIEHKDDIRMLLRLSKCCGACRAEVCSYVAAKRESGIVITKDPVARRLLSPHFPEVAAFDPDEFLRDHQQKYQQQALSDQKFVLPLSTRNNLSKVNVN